MPRQSNQGGMTPKEYQEQAMRTVYPDLTYQERLGLAGLGLSGEVGEVTDLLKKFLYHKNGKELDSTRIVAEAGDVLWYLNLLFETIGVTWEHVMQVNIDKLEARHPHGFTPRYTSDSHVSE